MATKKHSPSVRINRRRAVKPGAARGRVRKNMDMDAAKLQAAQVALGTKSETETVDRALDLVLGRARFDAALDRISERGGFQPYDTP
jgi:hypothetical protein